MDQLEAIYRNMQDVEFTIEDGALYMLQTRNGKRSAQAMARIAVDLVAEGVLSEQDALLTLVEPDQVRYENGCLYCADKAMSLKDLGSKMDDVGGPVSASVSLYAENWGPAFATHIVDVEVDPETGKVQILRYTAVQDVGTAIHPAYVEGQLQGGVAQGVGWALNEEYVYDKNGRLLNASLLDYRIPTCLDLPMIETVLVEVPNPGHPYGVRGVGEVPIVPPPAAIANAISRAIGVRLNVLPMSPARVLEALWAKGDPLAGDGRLD
jgi:CO/xanthine dehydrogenase Mo-binding subunit